MLRYLKDNYVKGLLYSDVRRGDDYWEIDIHGRDVGQLPNDYWEFNIYGRDFWQLQNVDPDQASASEVFGQFWLKGQFSSFLLPEPIQGPKKPPMPTTDPDIAFKNFLGKLPMFIASRGMSAFERIR